MHTEAALGLNRLAASATTHCLTGCAIGEVLGLAIGTAFGWSNFATIVAAVGLAFFFGYSFTAVPLLRSGLGLAAASDRVCGGHDLDHADCPWPGAPRPPPPPLPPGPLHDPGSY